ncbi:hypothetical protein [uncultured Roseibium sp.]|uniref:hypothetical protein n=1 Tax=uncultured Roseibium sp. TaxID=1936171 RepID=UPI00262BD469|nr:hypothetical protein [uncultured Roseibium sp.]
MAEVKDVAKNPLKFNKEFSDAVRAATQHIYLSREQFNAVKHAGFSAVMADVLGEELAEVFGNGVEFVQDIRGIIDQRNVTDDHKDLLNNAIGRAYAKRNPGLSANKYYQAMAALAQSGNLVANPRFKLPGSSHPRLQSRVRAKYIQETVEKALQPETIGLLSKPLAAKNPADLNGPEGKVFDLPEKSRSQSLISRKTAKRSVLGNSKTVASNMRRRHVYGEEQARNPFDLNNPKLERQAEMLERNPARARQMIKAAGRDPELFGL